MKRRFAKILAVLLIGTLVLGMGVPVNAGEVKDEKIKIEDAELSGFGMTGNTVQTAGSYATQICCNEGKNTAVVTEDGNLWIWGNNYWGVLGDGTDTDRYVPQKLMGNVQSISLGDCIAAAVTEDGDLFTWGPNNFNLGDGNIGSERRYNVVPQKIMENVKSVVVGDSAGAAIKEDGSLWMWGGNDSGELGDGTREPAYVPKKIMENVISVSQGGDTSAAIKEDGSLWMWGDMLGVADVSTSRVPIKIMDHVSSVSLGYSHCAVIKEDGSLWLFGNNVFGEVGNGLYSQWVDEPVKIMDDVVEVSLGTYVSGAVKSDGSLWVWGASGFGSLGINEKQNYSTLLTTPCKIMNNVKSISIGMDHSAAIKNDGSVWIWGNNDDGQLGNGTTKESLIPMKLTFFPMKIKLFADVDDFSSYYYDAVMWAVDNGITNGLTEDMFGPEVSCTRGQIMTFLWRAMGKPAPSNRTCPFTDISSDQYYYDAILWAFEEDITKGWTETTFEPDVPCTRGQIVTFLWRTMNTPTPTSGNHPFTDISPYQYYYDAVLWAVEEGVTTGLTATKFAPETPCTRAQIVTFLYRALAM